ncbi:MAG: thermonuclease family protein [Rhizobiaceae bacterium]|nr:thermonuclease family protein [Rhizobiaceae bacterium]
MLRIALVSLLVLLAQPATARETMPGPVTATVEKVIDGDTLVVRAAVWPGHSVRVSVRLRGIDAPEMKSRCATERAAARRAKEALAALVGKNPVVLTVITGDKYFGRVLADVAASTGMPLAESMLGRKLVRPYRGGRRTAYCR